MGLSASQTRFLSLTARKSNVEFQGQQINQARTALANQSSELFTQMMSLQAPIAPSVYTYVIDPATNPNIDWTQQNAYPLDDAGMKNFGVYYAGNQPQFQDFNIPEYRLNDDGTYSLKSYDENGKVVWGEPVAAADMADKTYCLKEMGKNSIGESVSYYSIHIANSEQEKYEYDIETCMFKAKGEYTQADMPTCLQAYNNAAGLYSTYSKPKPAAIYASTTPLDGLKTPEADDDPTPAAYSQTATESQNLAQYNQAMAQYEVDKAEYDRALEVINAKTEDIHQADKKLELQLKQLDTEQEAINTEYDAVKKVIDKNIENTFKTFA